MDGQYVMTHSLLQYLFYVFQNGTYTKFQDHFQLEYVYNYAKSIIFLVSEFEKYAYIVCHN